MPTLRELTDAIQQHAGVRAVVILGADGLVIETHDGAGSHADTLAAHAPAVLASARQLAAAADAGDVQLVLLELGAGYAILMRLSEEASLLVLTGAGVALADVLFDLRRHRAPMAALV